VCSSSTHSNRERDYLIKKWNYQTERQFLWMSPWRTYKHWNQILWPSEIWIPINVSTKLIKTVKLSRYRPGQALEVLGGWCSRISRQSLHKGGKVVSPTHQPSLPPGTTELILNSISSHLDPRCAALCISKSYSDIILILFCHLRSLFEVTKKRSKRLQETVSNWNINVWFLPAVINHSVALVINEEAERYEGCVIKVCF
jgi:hypothetical protein